MPHPFRFRLAAGVLGVLGTALVAAALTQRPDLDWRTWLLFGSMSVLAVLIAFPLPPGISFNPQGSISLAVLFLYGWPPAVILGGVNAIASWLRSRRSFWRAAHDMGAGTISLGLAATVAPVGLSRIAGQPVDAYVSAGVIYAIVHTTLTLAGRPVLTGDRSFLGLPPAPRTLLLSAGMALVGVIIAWLFASVGHIGALFGGSAWLLTSLTLKATVEARAAKARMVEADRRLDEALLVVERLSITDPLTGLYNRRHLHLRLEEEFKREARTVTPFSLVLLDLAGFTVINEMHGHPIGDVVLQQCARLLDGAVRSGDLIFRFGRDEFALILSRTDRDRAEVVAARLSRLVAGTPFVVGRRQIALGVTAGVATAPTDGADADSLIASIDAAIDSSRGERHGAEDAESGRVAQPGDAWS